MKKYFAGLFTGLLAVTLALSALAISGRMTIEVDPINIQVNGRTFAPTVVNGKEVPVFAYEGTTYAPLRALAEAYGLEVGYDASANMATVADPDAPTVPAEDTKTTFDDEEVYQQFAALWEFEYDGKTSLYKATCNDADAVLSIVQDMGQKEIDSLFGQHTKQVACDYHIVDVQGRATGYYYYNDDMFGETYYVPAQTVVQILKNTLIECLSV